MCRYVELLFLKMSYIFHNLHITLLLHLNIDNDVFLNFIRIFFLSKTGSQGTHSFNVQYMNWFYPIPS
jgi:hypothetical protein